MRLGLERIELREFRCFQQLYVVMNTHTRRVLDANGLTSVEKTVGPLTVLVAKNGMGKTAVLDAIRILFGTFTSAFSGNSRVGAKNGDVRISRNEAGELRQADGLAVSGVVVLGNEHQVQENTEAFGVIVAARQRRRCGLGRLYARLPSATS